MALCINMHKDMSRLLQMTVHSWTVAIHGFHLDFRPLAPLLSNNDNGEEEEHTQVHTNLYDAASTQCKHTQLHQQLVKMAAM